jgi:hypothetical protein
MRSSLHDWSLSERVNRSNEFYITFARCTTGMPGNGGPILYGSTIFRTMATQIIITADLLYEQGNRCGEDYRRRECDPQERYFVMRSA